LDVLLEDKINLEKKYYQLQQINQISQVSNLVDSAVEVGKFRLIVDNLNSTGDLKEMGDKLRNSLKSGAVALIGTIQNDKPMVMCAVTDDLVDQIKAGNIVKEVGMLMGGGGGGKPHIATAGGNDINSLNNALKKGKKLIQKLMTCSDDG